METMEMMEMIRRLPAFAMPPFNYFAWLAEALQNRRHYCAASFQSFAMHGFGGGRHALNLFRSWGLTTWKLILIQERCDACTDPGGVIDQPTWKRSRLWLLSLAVLQWQMWQFLETKGESCVTELKRRCAWLCLCFARILLILPLVKWLFENLIVLARLTLQSDKCTKIDQIKRNMCLRWSLSTCFYQLNSL